MVKGGMHGKGWVCMARGACMAGGMYSRRACVVGGGSMAGETATAADGMHPTGMRSCFFMFLHIISIYLDIFSPNSSFFVAKSELIVHILFCCI